MKTEGLDFMEKSTLEILLETITEDVKEDPATIKDYGLMEGDISRLKIILRKIKEDD